MLKLLAHAVHIVRYEVNGLTQRIGAATEDLNGLPHEVNVFRCECLVAASVIDLAPAWLRSIFSAKCIATGAAIGLLVSWSLLLLFADAAHLDLGTRVLISGRLVLFFLSISEHSLGLLDKLALAIVLEISSVHSRLIVLFHGRWLLLFLIVTVANELLGACLLSSTHLLSLHLLHAPLLLHLLSLTFGLLLSDALAFLFLTTLFLFLLLATTLLLFLLFGFFLGGGLGSCFLGLLFGLHLGAHSCLVITTISGRLIIGGTPASDDLLHVRCCIDARGGRSKHGLQEKIGLLWLLTGHYLARLNINLFANDELGQANHLHQKVDFGILFSDGFRVQFGALIEASTELSGGIGGRKDIMEVSEGGLGEQLLVHLGLLEQLSVHLSCRLPKVVTHT